MQFCENKEIISSSSSSYSMRRELSLLLAWALLLMIDCWIKVNHVV
jgi:hypothetical protein